MKDSLGKIMKNAPGENIRSRRKQLDMTLEQLANKTDISLKTIAKYETGDIKNIPTDKIERIARALKIKPSILMGWEDDVSDIKKEEVNGIFINPNVNVLLNASKNVTLEELDFVYNLVREMKKN